MASLAILLLKQQVFTPAEFVQVPGSSMKARYDNAIVQGRRENTDAFWVAYQFPVRPGVRVSTWGGNTNISRGRTSDGIEFLANTVEAERVALFMLVRKSDGIVDKTRLINLKEEFRIHDRKVFWLGEPNDAESAAFLAAIVPTVEQRASGSILMTIGLHPEAVAGSTLLQIGRNASSSSRLRKDAVYWLGQEVSRQSGDELERMANLDPDIEVQKQAVFALSRQNTDSAFQSLSRIAREHPNVAVRKQAIYWLGQNRDPRALDLLETLLKN
jgi:hypothetical protein